MNEAISTQSFLPFTGERFTPECVREIAYEHWHRYAFAVSLVRDKQVLDAACGEGFGAAMLATNAQSVQAVDIDSASIGHAKKRYGQQDNLAFLQADVTQLDRLADKSFDVIISFETLEHVYFDEFSELLDRHFPAKKLYSQKLLFQSCLYALDQHGPLETLMHTNHGIERGLKYPPMYYVAACAKSSETLAAMPSLSLYGDAEESVYAHYYQEIRFGIWARRRIAELERQLENNQQANG